MNISKKDRWEIGGLLTLFLLLLAGLFFFVLPASKADPILELAFKDNPSMYSKADFFGGTLSSI